MMFVLSLGVVERTPLFEPLEGRQWVSEMLWEWPRMNDHFGEKKQLINRKRITIVDEKDTLLIPKPFLHVTNM